MLRDLDLTLRDLKDDLVVGGDDDLDPGLRSGIILEHCEGEEEHVHSARLDRGVEPIGVLRYGHSIGGLRSGDGHRSSSCTNLPHSYRRGAPPFAARPAPPSTYRGGPYDGSQHPLWRPSSPSS